MSIRGLFLCCVFVSLCFVTLSQAQNNNFNWKRLFTDNFDRPNGSPGSNWTTPFANQPVVMIVNDTLCGSSHAVALLSFPLNYPALRFGYNFTASQSTGFESYIVGAPSTTELDGIWISGSDGGYSGGGYGTPSIQNLNGTGFSSLPIPMAVSADYHFESIWASVNGTTTFAQFQMSNASGVLGQISVSYVFPQFNNYGVVIGRDSGLTCISDFFIDISD